MEIQEKNGFSIVGFIAQVLVILLFVFVLMWLFPTKSYLENNGTAGAGTGSNSALSELLFNQNLLSMKDAAREYYTVKRMPSTNGNSKSLTLDEMIKNSMVVEFVDANGNKCDRDASYVKVTKVDNEYEMEISLTCGKVTKTIKTTVGCYNYCESGLCEKKNQEVTLYQYSKTTEGTSKWSKWSEWSKTEVTETSKREVETKVKNEKVGTTTTTTAATATTTYSCPEGYTLSADKKTCIKPTSTTEVVDAKATTTYSCATGYTLSADKKTCSKTTSSTSTVASTAKTTYSCATGYTLSDKKCYKTTSGTSVIASTGKTKYSCATGKLNSQNKCDITVDVYKDVTYYRYRTLTTTESKTVYKWSTSSNDQKLIKAGYKYTGVTKTSTSK